MYIFVLKLSISSTNAIFALADEEKVVSVAKLEENE